MLLKYTIALCVAMFISVSIYGQGGIIDSLHRIDSVVVVGKTVSKQSIGSKIVTIDKMSLVSAQTKDMGALLLENSAIQIKSMGQGALATISLRGTASSHTQVLWNGISLNSPTLGNFDFSEIPVFFTDDVSLHYGTSIQQGGSGALGGSVNFSTDNTSQSRPTFKLLSEYGSNNTFTEGFGFRTTHKRLTLSTRLYYQQSDNNYRYLNNVYSVNPFYERRKAADYNQAGAMQEAYYTTKSGDVVSAVVWWQYGKRNLPQPLQVGYQRHESTKTQNIRSLINYEGRRGKHSFKATVAYLTGVFDYFADGLHTNNNNYAIITKGEYTTTLGNLVDFGADLSYRLDRVRSGSFAIGLVDRNTVSSRLFATIKASKRVYFEGQVMAESVDGRIAPTYKLAVRYRAIDNLLSLKATNAYNYRFPSLNDLYWEPGGNPDLKSEKGFAWDATVSLTPRVGGVDVSFDASCFLMNIDNWIMWIPTGNGYVWKPANFSKVRSQGLEFGGSAKFKLGQTEHKIVGNYSYTHSTDRSPRGDGTYGRQLPYMPRNRWNATYHIGWKNVWARYNVSFTDTRFISADESYSTNSYTLHNAEIGGLCRFGKAKIHSVSLTSRVDNLFDSYYESTQYYPMPLRMYSLRAAVSF